MPEITGFKFKGWKSGGKKVSSIPSKKLKDKMDITAEYVELTYTIQYKMDKPKDNAKAKPDKKVKAKKVKYSEKVALEKDIKAVDSKSGDTFVLIGWTKTQGSDTVDFVPGAEVSKLAGTTAKDKKIVLYPVWKKA